MAMIKIILAVLSVGCVFSQDVTNSQEIPDQQQMAQMLNRLLEGQQQIKRMLTSGTHVDLCSVEVQAYSANNRNCGVNNCTERYGFVGLNGVPVWQASWAGDFPNLRGVTVIIIDQFNCLVKESRRFDTWIKPPTGNQSASTQLSNYLRQLNHGSFVVGVSGDEPTRYLSSALSTLMEIGVDVTDVGTRGAFGFVAQKGFLEKTVLRKALTEEESNTNQPRLSATVKGCPLDDFFIDVE